MGDCMKRMNQPGSLAIKEYLLEGKPITQLEALAIFGVSWLPQLISQLKREGYRFNRENISYLKLMTRMRASITLVPPRNLPLKEILFTEWWISK